MNKERLKEIKQILTSSFGRNGFEIVGGRVTVHYPELWIRDGKNAAKGLDYWARFHITDECLLGKFGIQITRTTFAKEDPHRVSHPHGGGRNGEWARTCQGGLGTPINRASNMLYSRYSKEIFMAFLSDLKVFMEYDNYGAAVACMTESAALSHPVVRDVVVEKEFAMEVLKEALKNKNFGRSIKFNPDSGQVSISEAGIEIIKDIVKAKGREDLLVLQFGFTQRMQRDDKQEVIHTEKKECFKFRNKPVFAKTVNYIYDEKAKKFPHDKLITKIRGMVRDQILEKLAGRKKAGLQGAGRNRSKTSRSNNKSVPAGS